MSGLHAAALRIELHINESQSLKAKRAVLRPLISRLEKMRVAVSEVDHQDAWQFATIGVAVVAPQRRRLDEMIESVKRALYADPRLEVVEVSVSHLEKP
ncbi:MAG TPA: DUF503 domain-containing protein [Acidimicrobiia bacterium]|nr:DUF503 domain-containing protein [Acidimicrobiia bacterium]